MTDVLIAAIIGLLVGGALGWLLAQLRAASRLAENTALARRAEDAQAQLASANTALDDARARIGALEREAAAAAEQIASRERAIVEQKQLLVEAEKRLSDTFKALSADALRGNNQQFLDLARKTFESLMTEAKGEVDKKQQAIDALLKPIRELLEKQNTAVQQLEKQRVGDYEGLRKHIEMIVAGNDLLRKETHRLVAALRRPESRGRWGEMQLRRTVELAGMTAHVDFSEQPQTEDSETRDRPDMTVHLPGEGVIVVDAKVALDAYLDSIEAEDPDQRSQRRVAHARQIEEHVRRLAAKAYWEQFARTPRLVVMFVPLESALQAAIEVRPDLHEKAMRENVLIATPMLLIALLRAVAFGWQQEAQAENAHRIAAVGRELFDRLGVFVEHMETLGKSLNRSTKAYNSAVGSLERRILPVTQRLRELGATDKPELKSPDALELEVREMTTARDLPPGDHSDSNGPA